MILNDKEIIELFKNNNEFKQNKVEKINERKVVSFGCEGFSYDIKLGSSMAIVEYKEFESNVIDPKSFNKYILKYLDRYDDETGEYFLLPPHAFALSHSLEYIEMPKDCIAMLLNKSTYARCGVDIDNTKIEPNFKGQIVLELHNKTDYYVKVYVNEGIGSLVFFKGNMPSNFYEGKYQEQIGITVAK